jgi:hypothetical protein
VIDAATVRKIVFLYNILILENTPLAVELIKDGIVGILNEIIMKYTTEKDEDMVEKALRTLHTLIQQQKGQISEVFTSDMKSKIQQAQDTFGADNLNLDKNEWDDLLSN